MRKNEKKKQKKKYILGWIVIVGALLILVGAFYTSYAYLKPVKTITFSSKQLHFQSKEPGSWNLEKNAEWVDKNKAKITLNIETVLKENKRQKDIILVLNLTNSLPKLDLLRSVIYLSNEVLNDQENRIALVTFAKEGNIVTNFTNDKEKFSSFTNNMVTDGEASYYQGLLKVEEILKGYQKQENRDCIVLFLTDSSPNRDLSVQESEYQYLKSQYPYLRVNGIQYNMYEPDTSNLMEPIDPLKNISDRQFKANSVTLNETFLEAITYPIEYKEFILNDVIENEYFEIDSIKQISSSYGNVQLEYEGSPKITWDLSNLATGAKEQLTIEVELNDTYMNNIGVYPTNKEESVYYKIGNVEETISSTQTPILSSHYEVSYDANLPDGCVIEDIPSTTIEQVYNKVTISETNPKCEGYQFDGWKIATESTWQMNEDCFLMPEHNVLLRAEWSKLSIKKSMEGDIFVVYPPILQNTSGGYQGEFWQYKEQITKVIFQNEVRPLNNTKETFDVSEKRNGSVLARLVANEENLDTYTVYIQGEGGVIANRNLNNMFDGFANLVTVEGFENLDTSNTINMDGVFANCQSLKSVDLSSLNVSNVTILKYLFYNCKKIETINLGNIDTSKVETMQWMFGWCETLKNIDLSGLCTSSVIDMSNMFAGCSSLTSLNISNFDTSNVTDMHYMFLQCRTLTDLNLSNFNTSKVENTAWMFQWCYELENLDISNFNTQQVTNMQNMFDGCRKLLRLDLSSFNTSNVKEMQWMFYDCKSLTELDVSMFDTSNVTNMDSMFRACAKVATLDLSNFNTKNVQTLSHIFAGCSSLSNLEIHSFDTSNVTDMSYMFYDCGSLLSLDLRHFHTSNVTTMESMFQALWNITTILQNFDTSNVENMSNGFMDCQRLETLNITNFNTSKVTKMDRLFWNCASLVNLDLSKLDTSNVVQIDGLFHHCWNLTTTITIRTKNATYADAFVEAAINSPAKIVVNYTNNSSSLVDSMLTTKSSNSNVVKGTLVS